VFIKTVLISIEKDYKKFKCRTEKLMSSMIRISLDKIKRLGNYKEVSFKCGMGTWIYYLDDKVYDELNFNNLEAVKSKKTLAEINKLDEFLNGIIDKYNIWPEDENLNKVKE
jgi:hypothetical protein